jgi:hypothetical protein
MDMVRLEEIPGFDERFNCEEAMAGGRRGRCNDTPGAILRCRLECSFLI